MTLREKNTIAREYQLRIPKRKTSRIQNTNENEHNILNNYDQNN